MATQYSRPKSGKKTKYINQGPIIEFNIPSTSDNFRDLVRQGRELNMAMSLLLTQNS